MEPATQETGWKKTLFVFAAVILVLIGVLWFIGGEGKNGSGGLSATQDALDRLLFEAQNNFTLSSENTTSTDVSVAGFLENSDDDPFMGREDATLVIVEFSDFECPFCKNAFPVIREFVLAHAQEVKYIYRDFPVDEIHPHARKAAEAAMCAHHQEHFWAYHDRLFQNQDDLTESALLIYAQQSGLNVEEFETCFQEGHFKDEVEKDRETAVSLGVRGTPTWFVNGVKIEGVLSLEAWEQLLNL